MGPVGLEQSLYILPLQFYIKAVGFHSITFRGNEIKVIHHELGHWNVTHIVKSILIKKRKEKKYRKLREFVLISSFERGKVNSIISGVYLSLIVYSSEVS